MFYILIVVLVLLDQLFKWMVTVNIGFLEKIPVIDHFFYLTNVNNKGAAWGMMQGKGYILIPVAALAVIIFIVMIHRAERNWYKFCFALIVSGALGNLIDRIARTGTGVIDYLEVDFGSYIFPIFNLADICIVVGSILLLLLYLFDEKQKKKSLSGKNSGKV